MNKKIVIIDWSEEDRIGEHRDKEGKGLSGFYKSKHKDLFEVKVFDRGFLMAIYKFPKIEIPFKSDMHQWRNLGFNNGWTFTENQSKGANLIKAVEFGLRPVGFVTLSKYDKTDYFELARQSGLEYRETQSENEKVVGIAVSGTFGEHFDLEAFIKSYELLEEARYGEVRGYFMNQYVKSKIRALSNQKLSDYLAGYDFTNPKSDYDLIFSGLLFGHPIEATFARLVGSMVYNNKS